MWDTSDTQNIFSYFDKKNVTHVEYRRFELYMYTFWGGFRYKKRVIFDTIFMYKINNNGDDTEPPKYD